MRQHSTSLNIFIAFRLVHFFNNYDARDFPVAGQAEGERRLKTY
jgi:hypothetical protein